MVFAILGIGPLELVILGVVGMLILVVPAVVVLTVVLAAQKRDKGSESDPDDRIQQ